MVCGMFLQSDAERRYRTLQEVAKLVELYCTPTRMVYSVILSSAQEEKHLHHQKFMQGKWDKCVCVGDTQGGGDSPCQRHWSTMPGVCRNGEMTAFCVACINFVRKLSSIHQRGWFTTKMSSKKINIPTDEIMSFMAHPGTLSFPDKRTMVSGMWEEVIRLCSHYVADITTFSGQSNHPNDTYLFFKVPQHVHVLCAAILSHDTNYDSQNGTASKRAFKLGPDHVCNHNIMVGIQWTTSCSGECRNSQTFTEGTERVLCTGRRGGCIAH